MTNILIERDELLSQIDITYLLNLLNDYIGEVEVKKSKRGSVHIINLDEIIKKVIDKATKNKSVYDILKIDKDKLIDLVSTNHKCKDEFRKSVELLYQALHEKLKEALKEIRLDKLDDYRVERKFISRESHGLDYNFDTSIIQLGELTFKEDVSDTGAGEIRVDKVAISIPVKAMSDAIERGIGSYLEGNIYDEEELEERIEDMHFGNRGVRELKKALSSELISRINRAISIEYIDYLVQGLAKGRARDLITKYVERVRRLESYLTELSERADSEALITIDGKDYNILDILSRGDAFKFLPIVGIIGGNIAENSCDKVRDFEFGVRIKLNGKVSGTKNKSKSSYEHGIACIQNEDESYYKRLKYLCLYIFILFEFDKTAENIAERWEKARDRINKDGKEGFKLVSNHLITSLRKGRVDGELDIMKDALISAISKSSKSYRTMSIEKYITLYRGILSEDMESNSFFKGMKNSKEYLTYISIGNECREEQGLFSIPINIRMSSESLYVDKSKKAKKSITMNYETSNLNSLPIIFYSNHRKDQNGQANKGFNDLKSKVADFASSISGENGRAAIYIVYNGSQKYFLENGEKIYLYNLLYSIVSYMILDLVAHTRKGNQLDQSIFNLIRLHYRDEQETGDQIRGLSKVLEHMMSIDHRSSSQGINLFEGFNKNKSKNALKSLYSKVPKRFTGIDTSGLNKTAIVMISSRKSDRVWDSKNYLNTVYGEIVKLKKLDSSSLLCDRAGTFVDNYTETETFKEPSELRDIMKKLYDEGYKDIIYISKTPYTSNLNITNEIESLYFMDENLIKYIRGERLDQNIYPLYYDHIYSRVTEGQKISPGAYFISDLGRLSDKKEDKNKSTRGLFGLYSGLAVEGLYRSIILYSALNNSYQDQLLCKNIGELLENTQKAKSIADALNIYHCATFEKSEKHSKIKIDPYEKLMGVDGLGYHCIEEYKVKFKKGFKTNKLSLMADIKKVIDKENLNGGR